MSKMKNSFLKFLKHLQPLFTLPNSIEESQKQTEALLTLYIWSITTLVTVVCVSLSIFTPQNGPRFLTIAALFDALHLFFYFLIKRGFVRQANILTVWVTWLLLTGIAVTGGGLRGPIFPGYFLLTFLAGITLGGRQMGLFAVLSAITGFGMAYLEKNGILPNPQYVYLPFRYWSIQSANLLMLVLLQYYASWIVRHTLQKLNNELKERKEIEKSLSASQRRFAAIFEYNVNALAEDVIGLLDHFGIKKARLVGHDWGAVVAWNIALHHPDRLEKLSILNVPHPDVMTRFILENAEQRKKSWYVFFFQIPLFVEWILRKDNYRNLVRTIVGSGRKSTFSREDIEEYRKAWSQPGALTGMLNWYRSVVRESLKALFWKKDRTDRRVKVPTLILWGKNDVALGYEMAQPSVELCDDGKLIFFEKATHWVQHDEADEVNKILIEFLR